MVKRFIFLLIAGLAFSGCEVSSIDNESKAANLGETIKGIWWLVDSDTTYAEVLISDKIYWFFDERPGIVYRNYEVIGSDLIRVYYYGYDGPGNLFASTQVKHLTMTQFGWLVAEDINTCIAG